MNELQIQRFWKKINIKSPFECWEWEWSIRKGYGHVRINYIHYDVHRLSYELTYGKIPDGKYVLHLCNNSKCCNPNHLELGNQITNMNYKCKCGRHLRGEDSSSHKITTEQVISIRNMYRSGKYSQRESGEKYNISQTEVHRIIKNLRWSHIISR